MRASRAVFVEVVGFAPGAQLTAPSLPASPASLDQAIAAASSDNPAVVAAEHSDRAAQQNIRQTEGEFYPEASVVGSLIHERGVVETTNDTSGAQVLLQVRVPIYQAGTISSRVRAAKQQESQRRLELDQTRRAAERAAEAAWEAMQTARTRIASLTTQTETAPRLAGRRAPGTSWRCAHDAGHPQCRGGSPHRRGPSGRCATRRGGGGLPTAVRGRQARCRRAWPAGRRL